MPTILVQPEHLRTLSSQVQRSAGELHSIVAALDRAMGSLEWQVRQRSDVEGEWNRARALARSLADDAERLARFLTDKARSFDEADRSGAAAMARTVGGFTASQQSWSDWWQRLQPVLSFPQQVAQRFEQLGGHVGKIVGTPVASLSGLSTLLGGGVVGLRMIQPSPPAWRSRLERAGQSALSRKAVLLGTISPATSTAFAPSVVAGSSASLRAAAHSSSVPSGSGQTTSSAYANAVGSPGPIRSAVLFVSQWDGRTGRDNCGPASVAMAMAFYGKNITTHDAAVAIRGYDAASGNKETDFKSPETRSLLDQHGLKLEDVSSLEGVKKQLDQGRPVLIRVDNDQYVREAQVEGEERLVPYPRREGYSRVGDRLVSHVVVITGYDDSHIYINDPLAVKIDERSGKVVADPETGRNFPVENAVFQRAAWDWYGAAVVRK